MQLSVKNIHISTTKITSDPLSFAEHISDDRRFQIELDHIHKLRGTFAQDLENYLGKTIQSDFPDTKIIVIQSGGNEDVDCWDVSVQNAIPSECYSVSSLVFQLLYEKEEVVDIFDDNDNGFYNEGNTDPSPVIPFSGNSSSLRRNANLNALNSIVL